MLERLRDLARHEGLSPVTVATNQAYALRALLDLDEPLALAEVADGLGIELRERRGLPSPVRLIPRTTHWQLEVDPDEEPTVVLRDGLHAIKHVIDLPDRRNAGACAPSGPVRSACRAFVRHLMTGRPAEATSTKGGTT